MKYYLHYDEKATVNYCFLFSLFKIAERNKAEKLDNIITYKNLSELQQRLERSGYILSIPSISKIINDDIYKPYFTKSTTENKILLNTNYRKDMAAGNKFVVLNDKEINFLLQQKDKKLNKYYLYLKYYCGFSKNKQIDTTANQILSAIGYSDKSGNHKNDLSKYNSLLLDNGFISITKIQDKQGHYRNIYSIMSL